MDFPDFRRMVAEAMMALRKESDRVHGSLFQRLLPALPVEFLPDPGDVWRGVEVEVDLAESERMFHSLGISRSAEIKGREVFI